MVSNPVYRKYIKYFTKSRLFIYESSVPEVAELAAVRQLLKMRSRKSILEVQSNTHLVGVQSKYIFLPVLNFQTMYLRNSIILLTRSCTDRSRLIESWDSSLSILLGSIGIDSLNSYLLLTCSNFNYLPKIVTTYSRKVVLTYVGGGVTGSVFIKNSRSSRKKEYYRLQGLPYYRRYTDPDYNDRE